jgi:hypothetical protein
MFDNNQTTSFKTIADLFGPIGRRRFPFEHTRQMYHHSITILIENVLLALVSPTVRFDYHFFSIASRTIEQLDDKIQCNEHVSNSILFPLVCSVNTITIVEPIQSSLIRKTCRHDSFVLTIILIDCESKTQMRIEICVDMKFIESNGTIRLID